MKTHKYTNMKNAKAQYLSDTGVVSKMTRSAAVAIWNSLLQEGWMRDGFRLVNDHASGGDVDCFFLFEHVSKHETKVSYLELEVAQ